MKTFLRNLLLILSIMFSIGISANDPVLDVQVKGNDIMVINNSNFKNYHFVLFTKGFKNIKSELTSEKKYVFKNLDNGKYKVAIVLKENNDSIVFYSNPIIIK